LKNPVNVVESVLDLLLPVVLVEVSVIVPATLTRQLCDIADDDYLRVVTEVAVFLTRSLLVDVSERRHLDKNFVRLVFDGATKSKPIE
jgi:hypothetical protein